MWRKAEAALISFAKTFAPKARSEGGNSAAAEALHEGNSDGLFSTTSRVVLGIGVALLLLLGGGGWAATAHLNGAVIANGAIKVDRNVKAIQHPDGGVVKEIRVRDGDIVRKGQVLIVLEDVQIRAELSIVRSQVLELTARRARLLAEREGLDRVMFPNDLATTTDGEVADIMNGEMRLFQGNFNNRKSQTEQLEYQIQQLGEEITGLDSQLSAKAKELALIEVEYTKLKALFGKGLIETTQIYTAERELARMIGERGGLEASKARSLARTSELKLQILAIHQNARTEAQRELSEVDAKLSEASDRQIAIADRLARTSIRAPLDGTLYELSVHTIGGVITPAAQLGTVVPQGAELKIEAHIAPADIDQVSVGQPARLKFSTFNQSVTPDIPGRVTYVSAATSRDAATNQTYYVADVEISEMSNLQGRELKPGMLVDVFITTQERTAMSYLVKPLTDKFGRAFREE